MEYKEIFKLAHLLDADNIPYEFINLADTHIGEGYQIRLNNKIDALLHKHSYGGEAGLLEIMGGLTAEEYQDDSVIGWLSADEVYKRFKYCYEHKTVEYNAEIENLNLQITTLRNNRNDFKNKCKNLQARVDELECQYEKAQDKIDELTKELLKLTIKSIGL